jgi:CheY-like chemotaxis protein
MENDMLQVVVKPLRHRQLYDCLAAVMQQSNKPAKSVPIIESVPVAASSPPSMNILVAEDNVINQKLLVRILKKMGQDVMVANNGLEAFHAALKKKFDIVFMDIQMPEMDGFAATHRIRTEISGTEQPTIIAMTAHALSGDKEKCLEAGMDDYLSKPVVIDEIHRVLHKWYQERHNHKS